MKPIGYWLNRTDRALANYMDSVLGEFGLTRLTWRVLNLVEDGTEVADADVRSYLAADPDSENLTAAIATLLTDGWVHRPAADRLALTTDGRTRLATAATRVDTFRDVSAVGITPDEYRIAVTVLERMALNLESAAV